MVFWAEASDIDLHVYDDQGHHAFLLHEDVIPDAVLSTDRTTRGLEAFTDDLDPSTRRFAFQVCYFDSSSAEPAPTPVVMRWIDVSGIAHAESFILAAPGECRNFGAVALIAPDSDGDAIVDGTDNCVDVPNTDQADADGDGIGNLCERPPEPTPEPSPTPPPSPTPAPSPTPTPSPAPELGKSVVAGVVSGRVRIRGRNGKFRTLGANESIPLGSTVDATNGKCV